MTTLAPIPSHAPARTFRAILALLATLSGAFAQSPALVETVRAVGQSQRVLDVADVGRPALRVYTSRDGLPENAIQAVALDARGYLWVGTQDGLASFNGRSWTVTNLPSRTLSNFVRAILLDSSGALWCGRENGGLARLSSSEWTSFDQADGLPSDRVNCLVETTESGRTTLWAGTQAGLARFDGARWERVEDDPTAGFAVRCMLATVDAGQTTLWVGTNSGLYSRAGGRWRRFGRQDGLPGAGVTALYSSNDANGTTTLWAGTDVGVAVLRGTRWEAVVGSPPDTVLCLTETRGLDGERALWAGTETSGLHRFAGGRWTVLGSDDGLPSDTVWSLMPVGGESGTRLLWIGTDSGLVRLGLGGWTTYDKQVGLPANSAYGLLVTSDSTGVESLWIGTRGAGIGHFDGRAWRSYTTRDGLPGNSVWALAEVPRSDGASEIWAGTSGVGIGRYSNGRWSVFGPERGFYGESVRSFFLSEGADGSTVVWAASGSDGLFRIERDVVTVVDTTNGLPTKSIFCVLESSTSDGRRVLWVGTQGAGLACRVGDDWTTVDSTNGLPNDSVLSLCEVVLPGGRREIWAGTEGGGVARVDVTGGVDPTRWVWSVLDEATTPRLPNNTVYQIRQDARGRVYLFTNQGVGRLSPRSATSDDPAEFAELTFTTEDGLPTNEFNGGASALDYRGRIWGGSVAGAVMYDPNREVPSSSTHPLLFERREIMGASRPFEDGTSLSHKESSLRFEYTLVTFEHADDVVFRTQLVGLDPAPSDWNAGSTKEYTTLPAGTYVFRVWARAHDGTVVGPIEASFSVRPPPWLSLWAFVLYATALALAVYVVVRLRLRTLRVRNELLEARIAEKTADLAASVEQLRASERQALEAREEALEASRAKSVFLSNMSHELRTPLNALLGFAQLMDLVPGRSAEDKESLGVIQRSGEHLLELINDVLSLSKIESGRLTLNEQVFEPVLMIRGVEEIIRVRAEARGLQLVVEILDDFPPAVLGDEGKLRQVLINLLGNAVKFTQEGGVALRARWAEGRATFEVEDTGPGIAPEELGSLFQSFVQTQSGRHAREGTGLGLAISRSFVNHMGGDIAVRSELGRGTVFVVDVALPEAEHVESPERESRIVGLALDQAPPRVLVADDKWENRVLLVKLLTSVGFDVRQAADGREVLATFEDWSPHLVFMDMRMPVMDGRDATRAIREAEANDSSVSEARHCVVVALTASAFEHERAQVLECGCDDFVTKPFRVSTIFGKISEHLGVRYRYAEGPGPEEVHANETVVTRERLAALPAETVAKLAHALRIGNVTTALELLEDVEPVDSALAREASRIIRTYNYDELLDLIEGTAT